MSASISDEGCRYDALAEEGAICATPSAEGATTEDLCRTGVQDVDDSSHVSSVPLSSPGLEEVSVFSESR